MIVSMVLFVGTSCWGWSGLAHIVITQKAGYPELKAFTNLPDTWSSFEPNAVQTGFISYYFAWSHIKRTQSGIKVPISGNEDPAMDIINLAKKLGNKTSIAINTAKGWRAHIAADDEVHFQFFPGGDLLKWIKHAHREKWCEVMIYVDHCCDGDIMKAFDITINPENGKVTGTKVMKQQITVEWTGDANLIALAQKVYRKNQQMTDTDDDESIDIQTQDYIKNLMSNKCVTLQDEINSWTFDDYVDACKGLSQLITNSVPQGANLIHVKHSYGFAQGDTIRICQSNGDNHEDNEVAQVDYLNNTIILKKQTQYTYSANGSANSSFIMHVSSVDESIKPENVRPYEYYFEKSKQAVKIKVSQLKLD